MANYKQVSYGSEGSDVTELQKLLKNNGYTDLAIDGNFGPKTQAASAPAVSAPEQTQTKAPTFEYAASKPSDTVAQAEALLQQHMAQKPGAYQSTWQGQLNDTIQQILNRDKFAYDLNGDAMYQQLKDQYVNQGNLAMMDTMGQAQAMTGGYGNSYAQAVGQQAYQGYLQQLTDVVPELYGMARDQYNQEGQALYDQASLMAGMDEQEYGRYQDQLSQYYTDLNYLTENARYLSETEYQKALDEFNIKYGSYRDDVADQQWQAQFDEAKRQFDKQYALSASKYSSSTGGTSATGVAKSVANAAKKAAADVGSLLPGGKPEPESKPTMQSISKDLDTFIAGGADKSKISSYIRSALAAGYITESQAQSLLKTYTPRGYTY